MSNLDVAVATFWQLARHWKNGDKAKLELSCEGESLHLQMSARLGHPDQPHFPPPSPPPPPPSSFIPSSKKKTPSQIRRQERRRQQVLLKSTLATTQVSEEDAPGDVTVAGEAENPNASAEKPTDNSSSKDISQNFPTFNEAVKPKESAEKSKPSDKEGEAVSSGVTFKCDQCHFTSNSDKGLKTHTRMKHRISQLDGHDEDIVSEEKPCPLCPEVTDFCICGTCDECSYIRTEIGFKTHIMNGHEPPDVKKYFGIEWIKEHKHLISRNYVNSAQDRYHGKKWDNFMVL